MACCACPSCRVRFREVDFRGEDSVRLFAAGGGLQGLLVEGARGFRVAAIVGRVSLEAKSLRHQAVVLQFTRQVQRIIQVSLGLFAAAGEDERFAIAALDVGHPGGFVFQVLEGLESLLLGVDRGAETSLVIEHGAQGVGINGGAASIIHAAVQVQSAHVLRDRLIVLAYPDRNLRQVEDAVHDVSRHLRFFAQLQRLLVVGAGVFVLRLFKIDRSDVVQAGRLQAFIADIALDLQRFLVHFSGPDHGRRGRRGSYPGQ